VSSLPEVPDPSLEQDLFTNALTVPRFRTQKADKQTPPDRMKELIGLAQQYMPQDFVFEWSALIHEVVVRLHTNSFHQYTFWVENWFPAPQEQEPDAHVYSVVGVPDEPSSAYYCSELKTIVFLNTNYYGQCKSWSLGLADAVLRRKGIHSIHGSCVDYRGVGTLMIAPTGTGKSTHSYGLLEVEGTRVHSDDWVYVAYHENEGKVARAQAFISERKFYLRTDTAKEIHYLRELFDRCITENVVTRLEDCDNDSCRAQVAAGQQKCVFQEGARRCYWGFQNSRAILDPVWVCGPERFVHQTDLRHLVLLTRDESTPPDAKLTAEEAVAILKEGKYMVMPGAGPKEAWGTYKNESWYNPYLLEPDHQHEEASFRKLLQVADAYIINTGKGTIEENQRKMRRILQS